MWGSHGEYALDVECRRWRSVCHAAFSPYSGCAGGFTVEQLRKVGEVLGLSLEKGGGE